jgi:hypothetical protein
VEENQGSFDLCRRPLRKLNAKQRWKKESKSEEVVVDEVVTNSDNLTNELSDMLAAYRTYLDNLRLLNDKKLAHIRDAASIIQNVITRNNSN